jgi:GNAT superfamily N-acetyltransferase
MVLPFKLRRARPEDVFDVQRVHWTSIREGGKGHYDPEVIEVWADAFNPESFPKNLDILEFFVAELPDGPIAAFLAFDLVTAEVESVYVAPWGRGLGLGSFLLGFAEESARHVGLKTLWLDSSLNAIGFFAGFGWKELEYHARVRRGVEIPVVKMEKSLLL